MKKKSYIVGMLAVLLAFGLVIIGCDNGTKSESWEAVTDFAQLDGTWKGSFSVTITLKEMMGPEAWANGGGDAAFGADAKIKMSANLIQTFNAAAKTITMSGTMTQSVSGDKLTAIWAMTMDMMKIGIVMELIEEDVITQVAWNALSEEDKEAMIADALDEQGIIINEGKHSMTMPIDDEETLTDADIAEVLASGGIEINKSGTKLRLSAEMSSEIGALPPGIEMSPIIFIKQ